MRILNIFDFNLLLFQCFLEHLYLNYLEEPIKCRLLSVKAFNEFGDTDKANCILFKYDGTNLQLSFHLQRFLWFTQSPESYGETAGSKLF